MTAIAGVDVANATTEVAFLDGDRLLGADRMLTRRRKRSADSLRAAATPARPALPAFPAADPGPAQVGDLSSSSIRLSRVVTSAMSALVAL
jgi:hypothetical protein